MVEGLAESAECWVNQMYTTSRLQEAEFGRRPMVETAGKVFPMDFLEDLWGPFG